LTSFNPIYSILCIDGEVQNLAVFDAAFSQDYHISKASTGKAGLEILEQRTVQLVITSRDLTDMTGLEFLEKIFPLYPDCMRMIMTGAGDMDDIIRAIDRGIIFSYVAMPWQTEALKISIDNALEVYNLKRQNSNLSSSLNEIKQTLQRKVMERTGEIEQQRLNITDSILYARRIQRALMLTSEELDKLMPSHFVFNKPKDIVSGDFYLVSRKNDRLIIAVVDCTGHGVPGAFMSILGISLLNELVNTMDSPQASDILNELRNRTIRALSQTGKTDEAREGMEMGLCVIDPVNRKIQYSGAFRPLYHMSGGELSEIRGDRMPIGIYHEVELPFTNREIHYREDDSIYLFTDGYVDQIGGLDRKTFKSVRLKKLIREIWQKPMKEQEAILREEHEIWRAGQEQIDDIMVLGVKLSNLIDS
jgi:phosphoserine phosphatase RsbU/P